ncbi:MAG: MOSC domain-containing protein [Nitrospirales bacterium]
MTLHNRAFVYQINISNGGVPKRPIEQAYISGEGVDGDKQRNRVLHSGADHALCLYSLELIEALRREGHSIAPGSSGENFTISGLDWSILQPGDQLHIGDSVHIEMTHYAVPCRYNAQWFLRKDYKRISHKVHPGWSRIYAKVLAEGPVQRGDAVFIEVPRSMEIQV